MSEIFAGRFALLQELGKGGMGEVFLARDQSSGTECALKRLIPGASRVPADTLREEFEKLTQVRHPCVVAVYELDFAPDGAPFFTMEFVPGQRADRALRSGDWGAFFFVAAELARGVEALHAAGIAHGDLKPSNVLVLPGADPAVPAAVRLLDFGLATRLGGGDGHRGTPGFAAPETVRGEAVNVASDLYGLGATLYALIAEQPPFEATGSSSLLRRQQSGPPPARPLEDRGAPAGLVELVLRLMAPTPAERGSDAGEVRRELARLHPAALRSLAERMSSARVVGREAELARIETWLAGSNRGARLLVVAGAAGFGKTALLDELAARAAVAGRRVARVACTSFAIEGDVVRRVLRRLAADAGQIAPLVGHGAARAWIAEDDAPRTPALLDELGAAGIAWMRLLLDHRRAPLLLLDDVERLDPFSSVVLRRILLDPRTGALRWVWTHALEGDDALRVLFDSGEAQRLELGPLDGDAVARLAAFRLGEPAPPRLVEFLWDSAAGHPGLSVDLLRVAAERGALREDEAGIHVDADALGRVRAPEDFGAARLTRWHALTPAAAAAVNTLAILERSAQPDELRAVEPMADGTAIDEALRSGLLGANGDGGLSVARALASRILDAIPREERILRHRAALHHARLTPAERFRHLSAVGDVVAALSAADEAYAARPDERLATEAAELAQRADSPLEAAWRMRAAQSANEAGRYAAVVRSLDRAIEVAADPTTRDEARLLRCAAHGQLGDRDAVDSAVAGALAAEPADGLRARWLLQRAWTLAVRGDREQAVATNQTALALAQASGDEKTAGQAARNTAMVLPRLGRMDEAPALAERARAHAKAAGDALGEVRALSALAYLAAWRHEYAEAERRSGEALIEARRLGHPLAIEEVLQHRAGLHTEMGEWRQARQELAQALGVALETERGAGAALAMVNLALHEGLAGRPRDALRRARAALRLCRAHSPERLAACWRAFAVARRLQGRAARAERAARHALRQAVRDHDGYESEWARLELGHVMLMRRRPSEAAAIWQEAAPLSRPPETMAAVLLHVMAGHAALITNRDEEARQRLALVDTWLAGREARYAAAFANQLRAEIAFRKGRFPDAVGAARKALLGFEALPAPADRDGAQLEFARLAVENDAPRNLPVADWLDSARTGYERRGNPRARERCLDLLVRWLRNHRDEGGGGRDRDLIEAARRLFDSLSDPRELAQRAMAIAVEQLNAERGVLVLHDEETGALVPMAEYGTVDAATRTAAVGYSTRVVQRVADSGGSLLIADAPSDPRVTSDSVIALRLRSIVCVPMNAGGKVVGAVYLDNTRRASAFDDDDRRLLEGFAELMASAIHQSKGREEVQRFNEQLVGENLHLRQQVGARFQAHNLIGTSTPMQSVLAQIGGVAHSSSTVLLTGENGTGKELIARTIHHSGRRRKQPFVAVNCGAITETLLESELFGILADVATGVRARDGRFVQADGGTLFLDEIGEMPLRQQVALLSVLTNREVTPVGGGKPIAVDVRIIAATNRDLGEAIEEGAFREDLFYRLNVIPIEVPSLRDRKADIPALTRHFVTEFARQQQREIPQLSTDFLPTLMRSDWPGNVRQLQNYVERIMAEHPGRTLLPKPAPRDLQERRGSLRSSRDRKLKTLVEDLERRAIEDALERSRANQSLAARELGLTEQSLRYRMRKYGLDSARQKRRIRRKPRRGA